MPVGATTPPTTECEFTLKEQWAIHQAFLDYVDAAASEDTDLPQPTVEVSILEKVEDGDLAFTAFELDRIRYECDHHAESPYALEIDQAPARTVVEKIDRRCRVASGL